jgi:hypothetical protein
VIVVVVTGRWRINDGVWSVAIAPAAKAEPLPDTWRCDNAPADFAMAVEEVLASTPYPVAMRADVALSDAERWEQCRDVDAAQYVPRAEELK